MTNFSLVFLLSRLDAAKEYPRTYNGTHNDTGLPNNTMYFNDQEPLIFYASESITISIFLFLLCLVGLVGNGTVIWLLGFHIKKNSFTTYILNLSIADFGLATAVMLICIHGVVAELNNAFHYFLQLFFEAFFLFMYNSGQLLLTVISIDRCVCVLFPIWHRCHRPTHLSTTVSALIWVLSFLLLGIQLIICLVHDFVIYFHFLINVFFCFPLMTLSALTLFIKVCFKPQRQRRKLLTAILLALLFFLALAFPLNIIYLIEAMVDFFYLKAYGCLCACLNSSVNPIFYFLLGRQKGSQSRESTKVIIQRMFKEEEEWREEPDSSIETPVIMPS